MSTPCCQFSWPLGMGGCMWELFETTCLEWQRWMTLDGWTFTNQPLPATITATTYYQGTLFLNSKLWILNLCTARKYGCLWWPNFLDLWIWEEVSGSYLKRHVWNDRDGAHCSKIHESLINALKFRYSESPNFICGYKVSSTKLKIYSKLFGLLRI